MHHRRIPIRPATSVAIAVILAVFLLVRLGAFTLMPGLLFTLILLLVLLSNLCWWAWVDAWLCCPPSRAGPAGQPPQGYRACRAAWAGYILLVLSPFFIVLGGGRHVWDALPVPLVAWTLIWHTLMVFLAGALAILVSLRPILDLLLRRPPARDDAADEAPINQARRIILIRAAIASPLVMTGAAVLGGSAQAGRFRVRHRTVELDRLPDRLRGLTITHISDLHLGRLFRPEHLPAMVDAANALRGDMVVITGDIVDHSNDFLPEACEAIGQLEHRHGRWLVLGNHDLIDSPGVLLDYLAPRERGLLLDKTVPVRIDGETIQVTGLAWSRYEQPRGRDPGHERRAAQALEDADPNRFTIGLAHHPHAFDALARRSVDLTLAGHTHGGQLMLTPPDAGRPLGAGNLLYRYVYGEYRQGPAALYVNAGIGNWFPVRINAPAEIVQIRLVLRHV